MIKYFLLFLSYLIIYPLTAQEKALIIIEHSDTGRLGKNGVRRLIGHVKISHGDIIMTCDSLHYYGDSNYVDAFSNVHVIQNDTLNLWGDFMTYSGNTTQAKVRQNVIMQDNKITLTTDSLDYNATYRIGYYFDGGTIKDSTTTLISEEGYYYVPISEMFFKDSVQVYTPEYTMYSDTLKYQTETKIVSILGPTNIYGDNRTIYSEDGYYNSLTSHAELYKNSRLTYDTYKGRADTIVIDSVTNSAIMRQNIHLDDTINNVIIEGHYGEVLKNNDYAFVTEKALLILVGKTDSLFLHGDTISTSKDSLGNNILKAYYNTKFYSQDLQGICDSMVFPVADSTIYLYQDPIVWASGNQMTATEINMHMTDNKIDRFNLKNKAMIISQLDSTMYKLRPEQEGSMYNQIKGRNITGYIHNNELYLILVDGSGELLYYTDDKGVVVALNKTTSAKIKIELEQQRIAHITFIQSPEGGMTPLFMVTPEDQELSDFHWYIDKKPLKKEDIFKKIVAKSEKESTESVEKLIKKVIEEEVTIEVIEKVADKVDLSTDQLVEEAEKIVEEVIEKVE